MEKITIKSFVNRLDPICTKALEEAASLCATNRSFEISVEHFLIKLFESENDVSLILATYNVNISQYIKNLQRSISNEAKGNTSKPVFSKALANLLEDSWLVASIEQGFSKIRSGSMLLAILGNSQCHIFSSYYEDIESISYDHLKEYFSNAVTDSIENNFFTVENAASISTSVTDINKEALEKYCINFTQLARDGKIDPVFCRDDEVRQMVDILARRRKNNPICVGEAGVGKTAVVEGLALKLAMGDVPSTLENVDIFSLDLGLLQAGASVKGEFENRLNAVIKAVKSSLKQIILFIDEAHTLIGAGGAAGSGDAANLLKPALARGELSTIAATTWSEYKKYFEKDPALSRRFQLVKLDEPTPEQAITIIRGIRSVYEKSHGVYVRDDAVVAAAKLSARYINGRQLPDKAVDVLDTAAARVKVSIAAKPEVIDSNERECQRLQREHDALKRDIDVHITENRGELSELLQKIEEKQNLVQKFTVQWHEEQSLARGIIELRQKLALTHASTSNTDQEEVNELTEKLADLKRKLSLIQGDNPLVHYEVSPDVIGQVISNWTGIPLGKMVKDESKSILTFAEDLKHRIKGQNHAISAIDKGVRAAKAGIGNPDTPVGVFLLVGPSGVGKTETCIGVADLLFGGERFLTTVNMSEFQEKHSVSRLIGSPPGYVGYGEGGVLTEAIRQRPYSVVLLDEVEKADLEVLNLFYQVFDKGVLSDGEGQLVDFKNTTLFLTSNLASGIVTRMCADGLQTGELPTVEEINQAIRPVLSAHFKPALLARMQVIPFYPISQKVMASIIQIKLAAVQRRLEDSYQLKMHYDEQVVRHIAARCTDVDSGARNIDHILNSALLPLLATHLLKQMSDENDFSQLHLCVDENCEFLVSFS